MDPRWPGAEFGRECFRVRGWDPSPAGILTLVIPGVDIFAGADSVADEIGVAVVADFFIANNPPGTRVHIRFQFNHFFGQALSKRIEWVIGAMVTAMGARVGLDSVERSLSSVDCVVVITEDLARHFQG